MKQKKLIVIIAIFLSSFVLYQLYNPSIVFRTLELRENVQSLFIFGDEDTCNWYLTLAAKRIKESKYDKSRLKIAIEYQNKAKQILDKLKDKTDINYLVQKLAINNDEINKLN